MAQQETEGHQSSGQRRSPPLPAFKREVIGGVLATFVLVVGAVSVGHISGAEAKVLLESMLPTARFLYSGVITASATILALMLTLLSLSVNTQGKLDSRHYQRVQKIALIDTVAFVTGMTLLVFLVVPLEESQEVAPYWYQVFYYVTIGGSALLSGLLVTVVLMLYTTVRDMIEIFGFGKQDHPLVADSDD